MMIAGHRHSNLVGLVADIRPEDERNRIVTTHNARSGLRTLLGLVAALGMVAAMAMPALAASVTPTPINDGNPTCSDFGAGWSELKVEAPGNGNFTDGTLEITISNFVNSTSGTPGSFDWTSNIGVDAVFVKAGNDKHNLYVYDPESLGDTDLGPQAGNGNGIAISRSAMTLVGRPRPRRRQGQIHRMRANSAAIPRRPRLPCLTPQWWMVAEPPSPSCC